MVVDIMKDFVPHDSAIHRETLNRVRGSRGWVPFLDWHIERPRYGYELSELKNEAVANWNSLMFTLEESSGIKACRALMGVLDHHYPARMVTSDGELILTCSECYGYDDHVGIEWPCATYRAISETK